MDDGYDGVREELKGWNLDELAFGLEMELSLWGSKGFDEGLVLVYLDEIVGRFPPTPPGELEEALERFKKRAFGH